MRRTGWVLLMVLALALPAIPTFADHQRSDERPPTPFVSYHARVVKWLDHWIDAPDVEVLQGPAAFTAMALMDELRSVAPEPCFLISYAAYWGLVPTLWTIKDAPEPDLYEQEVARFRADLSRATQRAELDAVECARAEAMGHQGHALTPSPAPYDVVVEIEATSSLRFVDTAGTRVESIAVKPGETLLIRIDNTAAFEHNFYVGTEEQLLEPSGTTDTGIETWVEGTRELAWTIPEDISDLVFGCTVPGHFDFEHGVIVLAK